MEKQIRNLSNVFRSKTYTGCMNIYVCCLHLPLHSPLFYASLHACSYTFGQIFPNFSKYLQLVYNIHLKFNQICVSFTSKYKKLIIIITEKGNLSVYVCTQKNAPVSRLPQLSQLSCTSFNSILSVKISKVTIYAPSSSPFYIRHNAHYKMNYKCAASIP